MDLYWKQNGFCLSIIIVYFHSMDIVWKQDGYTMDLVAQLQISQYGFHFFFQCSLIFCLPTGPYHSKDAEEESVKMNKTKNFFFKLLEGTSDLIGLSSFSQCCSFRQKDFRRRAFARNAEACSYVSDSCTINTSWPNVKFDYIALHGFVPSIEFRKFESP